ncbi:MAG: porin family protein [Rhizobiaceae bacterium]|nr:porin family protein [Rhizobiaceae bacterium]
MRHSVRLLASATAIALLPVLPAIAADYDPPMVVEDDLGPLQEIVPVEIGGGWYLRGSVGYAFATSADGAFTYRTFTAGTGTYGSANFTTASVSGGISYGIGFGYAFTDLIRADLTAERFNIRFNGTRTFAVPCTGFAAGTTCVSSDSATLNGTTVLANGYVDLGTFAGFTPYVGAGAGVTHVSWTNLSSSYACVNGAATCPATATTPTTANGESSWRFTYAAMAGMAYDINDKLKVRLGYKYKKIAGGPMFRFNSTDQALGATGTQGSDPGFTQHEVKLGLRYEIW